MHKVYNHNLQDKLQRAKAREERLQTEQQAEIFQKETVMMMAKYQLVFSQIESKFMKCLTS